MTQEPKKAPNPIVQLVLSRELVRELGEEQAATPISGMLMAA
jgi:hypothetical protein